MSISAIILAGGQGSRMNCNENKVFLQLGSHLIIDYSLNVFNQIDEVNEIICVYRHGEREKLASRAKEIVYNKKIKLVNGGRERKDSVSNALLEMNPQNSLFVIHDGARPLITKDFVLSLIENVKIYKAVIPGVSVKDTIKRQKLGFVNNTIKRDELVAIQTPQVFTSDYRDYLITPQKKGTDDASFIEGDEDVKIISGLKYNIKITTAEDLWFAETILRKVEEFNW
ncbi:MAG: 2-C-methyl-D-erythritol 4-phosphate cytidylyltransferase [Clostridia bacterium]